MKSKRNVLSNLTRRTAAVLIALAVPAFADTAGISGGRLIVGAEPGDGNQVFAPALAGSNLIFPNLDAAIVTPGCTAAAGSILCPLADFQDLAIVAGDGDDVIDLSGISGLTFAILALGGAGNDVLIGTAGNVKMYGQLGDDILIGAAGNCISGGFGNNILIGGGCNAGPDPMISPLPRTVAATPEPGELVLLGTVILGVAAAARRRLRNG